MDIITLRSISLKQMGFVGVNGSTTANYQPVTRGGESSGIAAQLAINAPGGAAVLINSDAALVTFTDDVYIGINPPGGTTATADMAANYAKYPTIPAGTYWIGHAGARQV
jgi:hypothetical protein